MNDNNHEFADMPDPVNLETFFNHTQSPHGRAAALTSAWVDKKAQNFISSNDYLSFLKSFGLTDVDFLKPEKTDMSLLPSKDILEDLNRDQINSFIRQVTHKIEDVLSCRLTDSEYQKITNIIAAVRERGKSVEKTGPEISGDKLKLGFLE